MIEKAPYEGHPGRCQAVNVQGQCRNLGVELESGGHANFCLAHGGVHTKNRETRESLRNYRLTVARWRTQLDKKADAEGIKSLRDEVAILRICLEERLNKCQDATDMILQSGPISDMVMKIERVVTSCHKLEGSMGELLDRQAILQFAQIVIGIVSNNIADEGQLNTIADGILAAVGEMGS